MAGLNETTKRLLIALIALPIIFFAIFKSILLLTILAIGSTILLSKEVLAIADIKKIRTYTIPTIATNITIIIICFIFLFYFENYEFMLYPLLIVIVILSTIMIFTLETMQSDYSRTLETVSVHLFTVIYCGFPLIFLLKLQDTSYFLVYIWVVTWMTDSGAYFVGKYLGKHKLNLKSSPNKTLEGFIGGVAFSVLSGILLKVIFPEQYPDSHLLFSYPVLIPMTFGFAILTIYGDLAESILKRSAGVKDSQKIIPGHGGLLDVMDSLLYTAPIFYFLLYFIQFIK